MIQSFYKRSAKSLACCCAVLSLAAASVHAYAQAPNLAYDLILQNGHVIDDKNHVDTVMDVAIKDGKIAKVAPHIASSDALKTIDVKGLYVTPGLIDIHVHVYAGTGERNSYAGDNSLPPDGFTFRVGVTTVVDAGCSGWRNFEDFKQRIIDRSKTRVLALLNIVGSGMRGDKYENNQQDMSGEETAKMALKYPDIVVGIKTAHYAGPEWTPVDQAVIAGTKANIPVMVDFGSNFPQSRPLYDLLTKKLRPGDIYTHMYSGLRNEQDPETKGPSKGMIEGRKRGIWFDTGTGGGSFKFSLAIPMIKDGFIPDSISTDLHIGSMNSATKDELNVASKMMATGLTLQQVVAEMTSHPAREIKREELGNLSVGSVADVAVLRLEDGHFGFTDMVNGRLDGTKKLTDEITIKDGKIVYDLNGMEASKWDAAPEPNDAYAYKWTSFAPRPHVKPEPSDNNRH
ncbi:MAG: amidohydrolase/deacetylase family metallohydrolase [Edaphobacter sp.]|uniref:amidohydrolase/deacetylase family metallohydrolase n=1 Tax=Edaphobacter sp. TaxID=1934404 RepID=UPI00239F239C|nr:amidohydrolase/deacetylase family metallohydrolase [Edaphobacter sp.]MDE1177285.1 amidohydrolase/deacetylase family metallohydrolase [Edaphobacter sp.]